MVDSPYQLVQDFFHQPYLFEISLVGFDQVTPMLSWFKSVTFSEKTCVFVGQVILHLHQYFLDCLKNPPIAKGGKGLTKIWQEKTDGKRCPTCNLPSLTSLIRHFAHSLVDLSPFFRHQFIQIVWAKKATKPTKSMGPNHLLTLV